MIANANANDFDKFPDSYDKSSQRIINTPSATAKKSFFYVQETGYLKILSSHKTERIKLNSYLIVYVLSGSGTLEYKDKTYKIAKGQCFFIDCMTAHRYYSSKENCWEILWVHFNGATSAEYYEVFGKKHSPIFRPIDSVNTESVMRNIMLNSGELNIDNEIRASYLIMSLLTQALEDKNEKKEPAPKNAVAIKQYLKSHYTEKLTLDQIASELFMSKFYMEKEFKRVYGQSIFDYIISKRINLAKKLLRFTDKSIEEISVMCCFTDQSYFNRQFKKAEGITGSAYRKKWRS